MPVRLPVATLPSPAARHTLDLMRRIAPPSSVVHVGAGNGVAASRLWQDAAVEHLLLIEADAGKASELSAATKILGWSAICALLGERDGRDAAFHVTSNPSANGLVGVDELRAVWPNLRGIGTHTMPECRLERFLDARDPHAFPAPNWIFVDCLPALPILKGAGGYLDNLDVIWARVVLDTQALGIDGSSVAQLTEFVATHGFRPVDVVEGVHPALGDAFFFRDWRGWLEPKLQALANRNGQLAHRCEQGLDLAAKRQREIKELTADRDAQANLADERAAQIEELARQQQAAVTQLTREREEQTRIASDLNSQLCRLTLLHDAQPRIGRPDRQEMRNVTPFPQLPLGPSADLEGHFAEFDVRQRRMDDELIRAEAQIDLIKDLLFGESRS
jgi:hypothetical protein